ncbi:carbohydrate porin [Bradyrhizobium sp. Ash2021]|uniref:carbohydrate porin n=1 Tax=Bradyrhizobium sp. Ash2021 TaxID=2954771 RepID=UPI0028168C56|nr:carbohydrate porin [Bradyrhizobium sp. Ash2021]WMT75424.1 carbohydrate porin [Bradyrhizobium sp. Ash2021]WMT75935.1 carbohydrate porin [Bradyrhizobium sp. Ash2021]
MPRIGRRRWALAAGVVCLFGAFNELGTKAWAQAQRSDNPATPGGSYATGDWGGVRSYLERLGVTFTLSYTNDFLANVSGGIKTGAVGIGIFQPHVDLDLQKLLGWEGDKIHIHGLVTHGPFFSSTYLGNILAVSNLEAGPVARLYALWYEHNAPDDHWSVRAGLMLADSQFLQSETASNFLNNGISWPTFLAGNLPASGPAYPLPAPGIRVRVKPRDDLQFQAAVFSGDPSGGDGSNLPGPLPTGTVFSFRGGAFVIAEASYLANQGKDAKGLPGTYRIGAWYATSSRFFDQRFDNTGLSLANPQSTGIPLKHTGDGGVYGVMDQTLYRVPGTDDQGLSAFLRAGGVPNDRNLINFYADGGLLYKGLVPGRPDDKVGVAFAHARIGDNARGLDADTGLFGNFFFPVRSSETMIEMMYQTQPKPWWTLQPELQYIIRPGGGVLNPDGKLRPNAWVIVLRSALNF